LFNTFILNYDPLINTIIPNYVGLHKNTEFSPLVAVRDATMEYEMGGACSANGSGEKCMQILVGRLGGKRRLGRPKRRWEYNILKSILEK
jgi:hypothetical protein